MSPSFSPAEKQAYELFYLQADPTATGAVSGETARALFLRSDLSLLLLGQIWQLVDPNNVGYLDKPAFFSALRLIGHVQAGSTLTPDLVDAQGPLARLGDGNTANTNNTGTTTNPTTYPTTTPTTNPTTYPTINPTTNSTPTTATTPTTNTNPTTNSTPTTATTPTTNSTLPPISPQDREEYRQLFTKHAPSGFLQGSDARNIFMKSRLSNENLIHIWNLVDTQNRGRLNQNEFILAMHLIRSLLIKSIPALPDSVPASFLESPPPTWSISPADRAKFNAFFDSIDPSGSGSIGADQVVPFLTRSRLPEEVLAQIWDLADVNNTGIFTKNEFAIAMFLTQQKLAGLDLPLNLPPELSKQATTQPTNQLAESQLGGSLFAQSQSQPQLTQPQLTGQSQLNQLNQPQLSHPQLTGQSQLNQLSHPQLTGQPQPTQPQLSHPQLTGQSQLSHPQLTGQRQLNQLSQPQLTGQRQLNQLSQPHPDLVSLNDAFSQPPPLPQPDELDNKLSTTKTDVANLQNQVNSMSTQASAATDKRKKTESELARLAAVRSDLESKLAALRTSRDKDTKQYEQNQQLLHSTQLETAKLSQEHALLDSQVRDLQNSLNETTTALAKDRDEHARLKTQMRAANEEAAALRTRLEALEKDAKQQHNLLTISRQQLATAQQDRDALSARHDALRQEMDAAAAEVVKNGEQVEALRKETSASRGNLTDTPTGATPNITGNTTASTATANTTTEPTTTTPRTITTGVTGTTPSTTNPFYHFQPTDPPFDPQFRPSFSTPTASVADGTTDSAISTTTANTSPNSEFAGTVLNGFRLPLSRPHSTSSSVQNNAPMSVRGDLDAAPSRTSSPAGRAVPSSPVTSEHVAGMAPPEDLEIRALGAGTPTPSMSPVPVSVAATAGSSIPDSDISVNGSNSDGAPIPGSVGPVYADPRLSSAESYEMVPRAEEFAIPSVSFPAEADKKEQKPFTEFAPEKPFAEYAPEKPFTEPFSEQFDESSSDDDGPEVLPGTFYKQTDPFGSSTVVAPVPVAAKEEQPLTQEKSFSNDAFPDAFPKDSFPKDSFPKDPFPDAFPKDSFPKDSFPKDSFPKDSFPKDPFPDAFPKDSFPKDPFPDAFPKGPFPDTFAQTPHFTDPDHLAARGPEVPPKQKEDPFLVQPQFGFGAFPKDSFPKDQTFSDPFPKDYLPKGQSFSDPFPKDQPLPDPQPAQKPSDEWESLFASFSSPNGATATPAPTAASKKEIEDAFSFSNNAPNPTTRGPQPPIPPHAHRFQQPQNLNDSSQFQQPPNLNDPSQFQQPPNLNDPSQFQQGSFGSPNQLNQQLTGQRAPTEQLRSPVPVASPRDSHQSPQPLTQSPHSQLKSPSLSSRRSSTTHSIQQSETSPATAAKKKKGPLNFMHLKDAKHSKDAKDAKSKRASIVPSLGLSFGKTHDKKHDKRVSPEDLEQLMGMGFSKEKAVRALEKSKYNVQAAINYLLEES